MKNAIPMLVIVVGGVLIAMVDECTRKRRLLRYWHRPCMGSGWRHQFPGVPKQDIRDFLDSFAEAFMFKNKNRLKFSPDDKLMDVYRTVYPPGSVCDAMELETFGVTLGRKYGVKLADVESWEQITLGEIFEMTRNPNAR